MVVDLVIIFVVIFDTRSIGVCLQLLDFFDQPGFLGFCQPYSFTVKGCSLFRGGLLHEDVSLRSECCQFCLPVI
jgi:hypothetical protein